MLFLLLVMLTLKPEIVQKVYFSYDEFVCVCLGVMPDFTEKLK